MHILYSHLSNTSSSFAANNQQICILRLRETKNEKNHNIFFSLVQTYFLNCLDVFETCLWQMIQLIELTLGA